MSLATVPATTASEGPSQLTSDLDEYDNVRSTDEDMDEIRETMPIEMAINSSQALDFLAAKNERDMNSNILIDAYSTSSVCETDQEGQSVDEASSTIIERSALSDAETESESVISNNQVGIVQT